MDAEKELIRADIETYLRRHQEKDLLRFVAVGSVDDGKSTLIGRLLFDTGSIYLDQLASARKATQMAGTDIDLSLLTDGLTAEREQGITIDVAYRYFSTPKRKFIIADTPGHVQYTRNMVTGASTANLAIILVDARLGVLQQSRRHAFIASLLGIPHLAVCVNKMDLVDYDRSAFDRIRDSFADFSRDLAFSDVTFFPISALQGVNCVHRSTRTEWYSGPTVLEFLESVPVREGRELARFRYPVQYVLRPNLDYRGFAGRIASGVVKKGDPVLILPSRRTSRVRAIDTFEGEIAEASSPQSITIRLEDEVDVSRGDMLVHPNDAPRIARTFDADVVWMHDTVLHAGRTYLLKHTTQAVRADVVRVHTRKDMDTLADRPTSTLGLNDIGRVTVTAHRPLFIDPYESNRETGSFILVDLLTNATVAAGMVTGTVRADVADVGFDAEASLSRGASSRVSDAERRARYGVSPGLVLIVSSDPTAADRCAFQLERRLFDRGAVVAVLRPRSLSSGLAAARSVVDAGLLAVLSVDAPSVDQASVEAVVEGRPTLVFRLDPPEPAVRPEAVEVLAGTLEDSLVRQGWLTPRAE
ncbi:MAG: sulfate adenylyltransferase subunit CysN [Polyangiaceae bacterium]|jgi:sulfate adenylyltransferase large subunit